MTNVSCNQIIKLEKNFKYLPKYLKILEIKLKFDKIIYGFIFYINYYIFFDIFIVLMTLEMEDKKIVKLTQKLKNFKLRISKNCLQV